MDSHRIKIAMMLNKCASELHLEREVGLALTVQAISASYTNGDERVLWMLRKFAEKLYDERKAESVEEPNKYRNN